jgi:hypothetical protein
LISPIQPLRTISAAFAECAIGALLGADLEDAPYFFLGFPHDFTFLDGQGHGLLDVDIFACLHGGHGNGPRANGPGW